MPVGVKKCPDCSCENHYRKKVCVQCGARFAPTKGRSRINVQFDESIALPTE